MGHLRDRMDADIKLRGLSDNTRRSYLDRVSVFARHFNCSPDKMGTEHVREFLLYLRDVKGSSTSTITVYTAALRFFYEHTLKKPLVMKSIPWTKRRRSLPVVLSRQEVQRLIDGTHNLKIRALLMLMYGAGLRVSETCALRVVDIDSERGVIHVPHGKGKKSRYVPLSKPLLEALRAYWRKTRPAGEYMFPGRGKLPHMAPRSGTRIVTNAGTRAGITKRIAPHVLRHAFATHSLEAGVDLRALQMMLGHASIKTTARYLNLSREHILKAPNPLEELQESSEGRG